MKRHTTQKQDAQSINTARYCSCCSARCRTITKSIYTDHRPHTTVKLICGKKNKIFYSPLFSLKLFHDFVFMFQLFFFLLPQTNCFFILTFSYKASMVSKSTTELSTERTAGTLRIFIVSSQSSKHLGQDMLPF